MSQLGNVSYLYLTCSGSLFSNCYAPYSALRAFLQLNFGFFGAAVLAAPAATTVTVYDLGQCIARNGIE
ncbi:MAG: hypothetical protein ACJ796_15215 [Gemmatimonadaceae bacterium]